MKKLNYNLEKAKPQVVKRSVFAKISGEEGRN